MEKVAISENHIVKQESQGEELKKIEFNVNAKEFVPLLCHDDPPLSEPWNADQKPVITKKISDDYKPVFMDGMTEKFVEGPCAGNGKDPEIPFVRYLSKGQAIDFFNRKFFSSDSSTGEITFRNGENGDTEEPTQENHRPKRYFDNSYVHSNIFRPPYIDLLVQNILYCQQLAAGRSKGGLPGGPRRCKSGVYHNQTRRKEDWERSEFGQKTSETPKEQRTFKPRYRSVPTSPKSDSTEDTKSNKESNGTTESSESKDDSLSPLENFSLSVNITIDPLKDDCDKKEPIDTQKAVLNETTQTAD